MKCPDCGSYLAEMPVADGIIMRCFKCGGFWLDTNVLDRMTGKELASWRRISISTSWLSKGKGVCPADGMPLGDYHGEDMASSLVVKRCIRCGKLWFPGESLFVYKPTAQVRATNVPKWGVPLFTAVVLLIGVTVGVNMVQRQQQASVAADAGVTNVAITYAGAGKAIVVFKAQKAIETIQYKDMLSLSWKEVEIKFSDGVYVGEIDGLKEGWDYYFRIGGRDYKYRVK